MTYLFLKYSAGIRFFISCLISKNVKSGNRIQKIKFSSENENFAILSEKFTYFISKRTLKKKTEIPEK